MTTKNKEKLERKQRRKPPIPYTKVGKSKQDTLKQIERKSKENYYGKDIS